MSLPPTGDHHNHSELETPDQSFSSNNRDGGGLVAGGDHNNVGEADANAIIQHEGGEGAAAAVAAPKSNMVSLADFDLIKVRRPTVMLCIKIGTVKLPNLEVGTPSKH